jgi:hypothetical protein
MHLLYSAAHDCVFHKPCACACSSCACLSRYDSHALYEGTTDSAAPESAYASMPPPRDGGGQYLDVDSGGADDYDTYEQMGGDQQ